MLKADCIIENLQASGKKQALEVIAGHAAPLFFGRQDAVFNALIERERIGSTGIGCGVAIPHIKIEGLKRMYTVLARLEKPVDFNAVDNQPVDLIFALLAPAESKTTLHLKALAQISRFLKDAETCNALRGSCTRAAIESILEDWIKTQAA